MKKVALVILGLAITLFGNSQIEQEPIQTLFGGKKGFGGYLGFNLKVGELKGQEAIFTGGELAFVLNRSFNLGVAGYGSVNDVESGRFTKDGTPLFLRMGYGGLHLEPVIHSEGLIHLSIPILLGAGGVGQTVKPFYREEGDQIIFDLGEPYHESEAFLVAEPGLNLELNLFRFMRLAAGASYRFVSDVDIVGLDRDDITGWNANLALRVGWF